MSENDPQAKLLQAIHDLRADIAKINTTLYYNENRLANLENDTSNIAATLSRIDETNTRLETIRLFDQTIARTGYRPEQKRLEPSGDLLVEYRDAFSIRPSAYRR